MKKKTIIALYYVLITPISILAGYEFGIKNYKFAIFLVFILMILKFFSMKYWFEA